MGNLLIENLRTFLWRYKIRLQRIIVTIHAGGVQHEKIQKACLGVGNRDAPDSILHFTGDRRHDRSLSGRREE
jgi:hypothetical protein